MDNSSINSITFLWSIISTVLGICFLSWDIWQLASSKKNQEIQLKEKQLHKAQVKIWQHFANGINHNLLMITEAIRTNKLKRLNPIDFGEVLKGIQASANSLYTSLNEERLFTDEEIKQRQLEDERAFKSLLGTSASASQSKIQQK